MSRNVELEDRMTKFAARCVKVCEALPPKRIGSMSFADQLFRSSTGVAANYAEATELSRILSASVITARKGL